MKFVCFELVLSPRIPIHFVTSFLFGKSHPRLIIMTRTCRPRGRLLLKVRVPFPVCLLTFSCRARSRPRPPCLLCLAPRAGAVSHRAE